MLALALRHTNKLIRRTAAERGVRLGRFFTPRALAEELGRLLPPPAAEVVRILDAGAGTGILSAAAIEAVCRAGMTREIVLDAYENDEAFLPTLTDILRRIRRRARHDFGVKLVFRVIAQDFLDGARGLAEPAGDGARYDLVLTSPPVGVPEEGSPAAAFCRRIQPKGADTALLFAEAAAARLSEDGVMAAVLPLSFADGVNAAPLRARLLARAPLVALTLGAGARGTRRDKTLLALFRYGEEPPTLSIRVAEGSHITELPPIPYQVAVYSSEYKVLLAKSRDDVVLARTMDTFPCRLGDLSLVAHTGLAISARYAAHLRAGREGGAVPLLCPSGLYGGEMHFPPPGKSKPYLVPVIPSLAAQNRTMVLVKRSPSRREGRRLVAGVYLSAQLPRDLLISTENKLLVIEGVGREMEADLARGLAALLSSEYYERYALLTASAGVTVAALSSLPLPDRATIVDIGRRLSVMRGYSPSAADAVVRAALGPSFVF